MWQYFKKNEKVIMVILLLLIAPTFAFTGIIGNVIGQGVNPPVYSVCGHDYRAQDWDTLRMHVGALSRIQAASTGRVSRGGATDDEVIRFLLFKEEARRLGLSVSDKELGEAAKSTYLDILAWRRAVEDPSLDPTNPTSLYTLYFTKRNEVRFKRSEYKQILLDRAFPSLMMDMETFEDAMADVVLMSKLNVLATGAIEVTDQEVYDRFVEDRQKRSFDYVRIPASTFVEKAKEAVTELELKQFYAERPEDFEKPMQVELQAFKILRDELKLAHPPTDQQITERYEQDKIKDYKKSTTPGAEGEAPTIEYFTLEEKRDDVVAKLMQDREIEILTELIGIGLQLPVGDQIADLDMTALGENARFVRVLRTGLFDRQTRRELSPEVQNYTKVGAVLSRVTSGDLQRGEFGSEPIENRTGSFAYRVFDIRSARVPELAEVRDEVLNKYADAKAVSLARDYADAWKTKIEAGEMTLADFAKAENFEVLQSPLMNRTQSSSIRVDSRLVPGRAQLVAALFAMENPGEVGVVATDPLTSSNRFRRVSDQEAYLMQFVSTAPPDASEFDEPSESRYRREAQSQKQLDMAEALDKTLRERGRVEQLYKNPEAEEEQPGK